MHIFPWLNPRYLTWAALFLTTSDKVFKLETTLLICNQVKLYAVIIIKILLKLMNLI